MPTRSQNQYLLLGFVLFLNIFYIHPNQPKTVYVSEALYSI